jgi:hypothetical protein
MRPFKSNRSRIGITLSSLALSLCVFAGAVSAGVNLPPNAPAPMKFAADEIARVAGGKPLAMEVSLEIQSNGAPQSYRIERDGAKLRVIGGDAVGAMYGGLDVAEAIRTGALADLPAGEHKPFIAQRGLKFNLPLDLRTPSYADDGDAAQLNIPEMWSRDFWRELFDEMARDRFNEISLWNDNPFPNLVKVPEFPDLALNDVLRGNHRWFDGSFKHDGKKPFKPEMLEGAEVVKKMTIDEKIAFWREVMQMAKDRGIEVYLFTWNAFLFTEDGKDGLTRDEPFGKMIDYFRDSVRETVKTYPLLAGIGVTAGENMKDMEDAQTTKKEWLVKKEQWLLRTYGAGIRDALNGETNRQFRFIHRLHESTPEVIRGLWTNCPAPFDFSFKYAAVAHMYGVTNPPMIKPYLASFSPACRTWLEVRNDDIHSFRWGDPEFARGFVRAMPGPDKMIGFNMGPDGYCWGREAIALNPDSPRQLMLKKQWLSFMLWGRLSYEPALPDELFKRAVAARFPEISADKLVVAWTASSHIIPEVNRFFWVGNDLAWYPEACKSLKGFYSVRDFISGSGIPESGDMNIRDWRARQLAGEPMTGLTPPEVAAQMRSDAQTALDGVAALRPHASDNKELRETLGDIEAMAQLGKYYAAKIDGAAELALFDATAKPEHQTAAVKSLEDALIHLRDYAAAYTKQYRQPIVSSRVSLIDLSKLANDAAADIEIARNWKPGSLTDAPPERKKRK